MWGGGERGSITDGGVFWKARSGGRRRADWRRPRVDAGAPQAVPRSGWETLAWRWVDMHRHGQGRISGDQQGLPRLDMGVRGNGRPVSGSLAGVKNRWRFLCWITEMRLKDGIKKKKKGTKNVLWKHPGGNWTRDLMSERRSRLQMYTVLHLSAWLWKWGPSPQDED